MKIFNLAPARGARRTRTRVGRGLGSGLGKTSGKGSNGQKARSGGTKGVGFEGGQMPLTQKLPKRGFFNRFKKTYDVVNLNSLDGFAAGTPVDPAALAARGLVRKQARVKILGDGDAPQGLTVRAHKFSRQATEKLAAAGGKAEVI